MLLFERLQNLLSFYFCLCFRQSHHTEQVLLLLLALLWLPPFLLLWGPCILPVLYGSTLLHRHSVSHFSLWFFLLLLLDSINPPSALALDMVLSFLLPFLSGRLITLLKHGCEKFD